jgi:nucleoside-diphosphate-sugar epimerase
MKVLIPGGGGYVGSVLKSWLLAAGHEVTVYDTFWFGRCIPDDNPRLRFLYGDVRDGVTFRAACEGKDAVIFLASISNNDFCEENPKFAYSVNVEAMRRAPQIAKESGVKRFIYASSVAGYDQSINGEDSTEENNLNHATLYAQGKALSEGCCRAHTIVRSASVCGPSPRMRFDLTVNRMVHDACKKGVITVHGGEQRRSHVNIYDLCDFYRLLLDIGHERIAGQVFNVVAENQTVLDTARIVADESGAAIEVRPRNDNRSYTVSGEKAKRMLGFTPKRTVRDAVRDIKARFDSDAKGITKQWTDSLTNKNYMNYADDLI